MKKIVSNFLLLIFIVLFLIVGVLSTVGFETKKFNNLISNRINKSNNNVKISLNSIKFKIDINEISLFLETSDSILNYRDAVIPAKNIKVYIDFFSILKSETQIKKISLISKKINFEELKKISHSFKPSTFTSFLNNKVNGGKFNAEIDFYLNNENILEDFIARGSVFGLNANITNNLNLENSSFTFFSDKTDVLIQNFNGNLSQLKIEKGDLKVNFSSEIFLETNFNTFMKINKTTDDFKNLFLNFDYLKNIKSIEAESINNLKLNLDKTYKLKNFDFTSSGKIKKS